METLRKARDVRQKFECLVRISQNQDLQAAEVDIQAKQAAASAEGPSARAVADMQNIYSPWMQAELTTRTPAEAADSSKTADRRHAPYRRQSVIYSTLPGLPGGLPNFSVSATSPSDSASGCGNDVTMTTSETAAAPFRDDVTPEQSAM